MKYFVLFIFCVAFLSCNKLDGCLTSCSKVEFEGHDYVAYKCGYGVGICHSASCKLCSHGNKDL